MKFLRSDLVKFTVKIAVSLLILVASPLYADSQSEEITGSYGLLDEIVVTATKRDVSLQDVPLSISAVTGDQLEAQGIVNMEALATRVPSLALRNSGPGRNEINIRGISSAGGRAATVGFYMDEAPIPTASVESGKITIDPNFFDLARVEVLRGPQGTLYGSSSLGGTVRLITNQPNSEEFESSAKFSLSSVDNGGEGYSGDVMVNLPLVEDKAALRIVGFSRTEPGYVDRLVVPTLGTYFSGEERAAAAALPVEKREENVNEADIYGVRASLLVTPTDNFSLTPTVFYQNTETDGNPGIDASPQGFSQYQPLDIEEPFEDEFILSSLVMKYAFENVELTSATSFFERELSETEDSTETFAAVIGTPFFAGTVINETELEDFTQEFRLSSTGNGAINWVFGLFYNSSEDDYTIDSVVSEYVDIFGVSELIIVNLTSEIEQMAVFGELDFDLTEKLTLTLGLRWFDYEAEFVSSSVGILPNIGRGTPFDTVLLDGGGDSEEGVNPKLLLSYKASEEVLLFASATKGFRPGAPNPPIPDGICDADFAALGLPSEPSFYDSDLVWSYELGSKTTWFDNRLKLNGALFYIEWSDIQQRVELEECGFSFQDNLGEATSQGFELELESRVNDYLALSFGVSYTDAELDKTVPGAMAGQRVLNVPEWNANLAFDYRAPLNANWDYVVRGSVQHIGESVADFSENQKQKPSYELADLRVGLIQEDWEIMAYVENVFDEDQGLIDFRQSFGFGDFYDSFVLARPRTIGLSVKHNF